MRLADWAPSQRPGIRVRALTKRYCADLACGQRGDSEVLPLEGAVEDCSRVPAAVIVGPGLLLHVGEYEWLVRAARAPCGASTSAVEARRSLPHRHRLDARGGDPVSDELGLTCQSLPRSGCDA